MNVLMRGQVLGEISLLSPDTLSPIAAYASTAVELYCIDNEVLLGSGAGYDRHRGTADTTELPGIEAVIAALREDFKFRHPPQSEIMKAVQSKVEWEMRKKSILEKMKMDKRKK